MKYMTVVAQTTLDGAVSPSMTAYDEYQKAISAFHMELAYGAISDELASDMAVVMDSTGRVYDTCVVQGLAKPVGAAQGATESGTDPGSGTASDAGTAGTTAETGADATSADATAPQE